MASKGIHIWRLRLLYKADGMFKRLFGEASFGIFNTEYVPTTTGPFHERDDKLTGYKFSTRRRHNSNTASLENKNLQILNRNNHIFVNQLEHNDIVEMELNMMELNIMLSVRINDKEFYKSLAVEDCVYRAVVSMNMTDDGWELLSYQHTY